MATVYCEMLENIFEKTSLTKSALMAICAGDDPRFKQSTIKKLEDSGHVRVMGVVRENKGREKKTKHYFITPAGVRFLRECAIKDEEIEFESRKKTRLPWLKYIDVESTKGMAILGDVKKERDRIFIVGEAAMVSELAGATIPFFVQDSDSPIGDISEQMLSNDMTYALQTEMDEYAYTENQRRLQKLDEKRKRERKSNPKIESSKTASEVMEEAIVRWQKASGKMEAPTYWEIRERMNYTNGEVRFFYPSAEKDYIRYVHPTTIKYVALLNYRCGELTDKHDTDRGRFSGLLQSRVRTLLLYPVHKPTLTWPGQLSKAEMMADKRWKEKLKPEFREKSERAGLCGALLIQSPARFKKIWKDPIKALQSQTELGFRFKHLFVEEIGRTSAANLRDIMLTETEEYKEREIAQALQENFGAALGTKFVKNEGFYSDMFPLKAMIGETWFYFAVGKWIDIRQTERIISLMRKDTSFGAGMLCEKWQHEYYKIMIPEAITYWRGKTAEEVYNDYYGEANENDTGCGDNILEDTSEAEIRERVDEEDY